jgi:hypothetical protein
MIYKKKYKTSSKINKTKTKTKPKTNKKNLKHKYTIKHDSKNDSKNDNISILSYNISWESMSGAKKDWILCSNKTNVNNSKHFSVCVSNIGMVINQNKTDFITLQEATDYEKLLQECPRLKNMQYKVHNSDVDVIVTFWDKKYKIFSTITGEFEKNRPWMATIFTNGICLINVHFGHYNSNEEYKKMNNMIKTINSKIQDNYIKRYIISGDFNYDIKKLGYAKGIINGIINLDGIKFYHHHKHMLTCCISRLQHNDHIIDSYKQPIKLFIPKVEFMASDHKPIIGFLEKYPFTKRIIQSLII